MFRILFATATAAFWPLFPLSQRDFGVLCEGTLHRPHSYAPCTLDDVPSDGHAAAEEDAEGVVHLARLVSLGDESDIVPELVGGGEPAAVTEEGDACGGCLQADGRDGEPCLRKLRILKADLDHLLVAVFHLPLDEVDVVGKDQCNVQSESGQVFRDAFAPALGIPEACLRQVADTVLVEHGMKPVDELRPFLCEEYGCCDDAPVFGLPFRRHLQHTPLLPVLVPGVLRNQVGVVLVRLAVGGNRLVLATT